MVTTSLIRDTFRIALGVILIIIGLVGGLIPIFQGWVFGIPGLIILADYFPPLKRILNWAKKKSGFNKKKVV
tara:strand:- start:32265 stop:32480 length:216 start_codon:yes stop_codon:yes gene_type:complete